MNLDHDNKRRCDLAAACWFLTGATASGKTQLSVKIAQLLDAEIVSLDSMAIYRDMDIGTAKPSAECQQAVPHHLLDIIDPTETFSVSQYLDQAITKIDEIRGRGKEVVFVGGTALYLKTLLRGMFEGPAADWEFRKQIEEEVKQSGGEFLHERLKMTDPVSAHNLHPNDHRRIIRALEVFKLTGRPMSHWQMEFSEGRSADECRVFALRHPRPKLHERIEQRVSSMFEAGLLDEAKSLLTKYDKLSHTAAQAVGYCECFDHLDGKLTFDETIEKVRVRTRRFARHQETWFRGLSECQMIEVDGDFDPDQLAQQLVDSGKSVS